MLAQYIVRRKIILPREKLGAVPDKNIEVAKRKIRQEMFQKMIHMRTSVSQERNTTSFHRTHTETNLNSSVISNILVENEVNLTKHKAQQEYHLEDRGKEHKG